MPITPDGLLGQAAAFDCRDELTSRLVVNRAYYAGFHMATRYHDCLPQPGALPPHTCGVHETLYHRLANPAGSVADEEKRKSRVIGIIGKDLKRYRTNADYYLTVAVSAAEAAYVVAHAQRLEKLTRK